MKVNVWQIVVDHINTLRNVVSKKVSAFDIFLFFIVPLLGGLLSYFCCIRATADFYNISVTFFGVFVALLLNFQVAAFGIYNRQWRRNDDEKSSITRDDKLRVRAQLLKEINSNISYLIVVSIISIVFFLILYAIQTSGLVVTGASLAIYMHFVLTLLMVVKRSHILFKKEYDET